MKLTYGRQLFLTCVLVLLGNVLCTIFDHWIYRNIAFLSLWTDLDLPSGHGWTNASYQKATVDHSNFRRRYPDSDQPVHTVLYLLIEFAKSVRSLETSRFYNF